MSETTTAPENTETVATPVQSGPSIINVTEGAVGEIKRVMEEQGMSDDSVLRVGVAGGGCSGFSYSLGFDEKTDAGKDHVSLQHGLKVAVDKKSALYLDGTTIDFYNGLDKRGFTFDNPNAKNSCGCGSSFSS
ncbi:HesB/IscA family protein [Stratiformator vulcanicus]|uniref:Iron-sulfur cluster insertion protein ErpA n=1 Tax=Stratiformator vulcanicus TaxID=2527980 RepID=A0A517R7S1_9PLAN|nr:iron-sulfur cluster assembly accessory protein [Stratiformator vulcanicus]QDT39937.1 Iron-sulfur cluster insertion protein ErpA [Stratiformator vulcanicus]